MTLYHAGPKTQSWYGQAVGILILDATYPCIPGNVGNATTYNFPVRYKVVKDASIERLLTRRDPALLEPFINAAKELEAEGVRAITGACGFMALFQPQVRAAVNVPVFLSSLIQIPFIKEILPPGRKIAVISADATALTPEHFSNTGSVLNRDIVIGGMENCREFREAVLEEKGSLDSDIIEKEIIQVLMELMDVHRDIGAVLLECSDLPPYAFAVHEKTGLPVFDFITMIKYVQSTLAPAPYKGFM
ncbi:MAG: aspartate/glutamate racemase family protein [Desulfamplus sp.]|nr:aspartate/glutamate racemase family protein [Desulfamplus sp.]